MKVKEKGYLSVGQLSEASEDTNMYFKKAFLHIHGVQPFKLYMFTFNKREFIFHLNTSV